MFGYVFLYYNAKKKTRGINMAKKIMTIYEGALCCSTGVCGPEPDNELIEFNQTLKKIQSEFKELNITRANMSFNIRLFLENKQIFGLIKEKGPEILPIITLNDTRL